MRAPAIAALVGGALACRPAPPAPQFAAGAVEDDGHGELARASVRFMTSEQAEADLFAASNREAVAPSGDADPCAVAGGGDGEPAGAIGGAMYAGHVVPEWPSLSVHHRPKFRETHGLTGGIEGTVTWRGALPAVPSTRCGAIEPLAIGADRSVANVLVYIETVAVGRTVTDDGKPITVGGTLVKRGCSLAPNLQIVTPLPAPLHIHGDAAPARLRVTPPAAAPRSYDLQQAGRISLQVQPGVTRIDADDGSFASAWVVALDTPTYALTDDHGRFRLDELAAGTYNVTLWQPPLPTLANGALSYGPPVVVRRAIRVETGRTARLDLALGP